MSDALQNFYSLLVPGVYAVFAYTGHGFSYHSEDYIVPVDAQGPNPHHCFGVKIICDHLQQLMCRVFVIFNCCRSRVSVWLVQFIPVVQCLCVVQMSDEKVATEKSIKWKCI